MPDRMSDTIKHRAYIAAPIEKVFDTISRGEGWDEFFTTGTDMAPEAGSRCIWRWKDWGPDRVTAESTGRVVTVERPHKFAFTWEMDPETTIEFELTKNGDGTTVEVRHFGFGDSERGRYQILDCATGWGEAVTMLKYYLEHGVTYTPVK